MLTYRGIDWYRYRYVPVCVMHTVSVPISDKPSHLRLQSAEDQRKLTTMMQSSTRFVVLSRRLTLGQRQVQLTSSSCSSSRRQRWEPVFTSTNNNCQQRFLSTPQSQSEPDWVRASIQKLLEQQSASTGGTNEKETSCIRDLDKSLQALQVRIFEIVVYSIHRVANSKFY